MSSYVDLMSNDVWSEGDIIRRGQAYIDSTVSAGRQNDLRTIMLGHLAGMRAASAEEMEEMALTQGVTEQASVNNALSRADSLLLRAALTAEAEQTPQEDLPPEVLALVTLRQATRQPFPDSDL